MRTNLVLTNVLLVFSLLSCTDKDSLDRRNIQDSMNDNESSEVIPLDLSIARYSQEFAERFRLAPESASLDLPDWLFAMEFRVDQGRLVDPLEHTCHLKLYLSHDMGLNFPLEGDMGNRMTSTRSHFFKSPRSQLQKLQTVDRDMLTGHFSSYIRRSFLTSNSYLETGYGILSNLAYYEYIRNIVEGVDYLDVDIYCTEVRYIPDFKNDNLQIWLEKSAGRNYLIETIPVKTDFYTFELDNEFIEKMIEFMKIANAMNAE